MANIAISYRLNPKEFEKQYKEHISGFRQWDQLDHADKWILYEHNIGAHISIDETSLSNGELYTIVTNKARHGKQGSLIAMVQGTKVDDVVAVLSHINVAARKYVTEATLDMAPNMEKVITKMFPNSKLVTDRFHVQKLVSEAVQEVRMAFRRDAIKEENERLKEAKEKGVKYSAKIYENGDTVKQLLARSRYIVFKPESKWHESQKDRAKILFREFPKIEKAYKLSMMFRNCYETSKTIDEAKWAFVKWYEKVEEYGMEEFNLPMGTIQSHEDTILNYFINRSTNASAESFNAKLKGFRTLVRGVRDKKFFLFRIGKIYGEMER